MCPGLCVLSFKYLAAPTRHTTETAVGTGLPNHCLHQAYWFYFLNSFISSLQLLCACSFLFEDIDSRLSQSPQFNFFSLSVFILCYLVFTLSVLCACLHFIMMTMLVFCYVPFWVLIPLQVVLHLGISSPANSSVKNSRKSPIHPPLVDITHFQTLN